MVAKWKGNPRLEILLVEATNGQKFRIAVHWNHFSFLPPNLYNMDFVRPPVVIVKSAFCPVVPAKTAQASAACVLPSCELISIYVVCLY